MTAEELAELFASSDENNIKRQWQPEIVSGKNWNKAEGDPIIRFWYNKGYKDGAEATSFHHELSKDEKNELEIIRKEIEQAKTNETPTEFAGNSSARFFNKGLEKAMSIIDKHMKGKTE